MKRLSYGLLALWLFSSLNVYAQSYYLSSSTGDDAKDGKTEATAWKTLTRYHQAMKSKVFKTGDDIYFKRGDVFGGQMYTTLLPGGTAQDPFIIGDYGDPQLPSPVLSGLQPINQWQPIKVNGIQACVTDISAFMNNLSTKNQYGTYPLDDMIAGKLQTAPTDLLFDGKLQRIARYPNDGFLSIDEKSTGDTVLDADLATVPNAQGWVGAQTALRTANWEYRFTTVKSISGTTMKLADSIIGNLSIKNGYFFFDKLIGLDAPGEWFTDDVAKKMYFIPPPSVSCTDLENRVSASVFTSGTTLTDYTTLQNLTFTGYSDAAVYLSSLKQQMKVLNNTITNSRVGVRGTGVSFVDISRNLIRDIYGEAVIFWPTTNTTVSYNLIENVGLNPSIKGGYNGIVMGSDKPTTSIKNVISNNILRNIGYSGIVFRVGSGKAGEESIIEKNVIERALALLADGGAIYLQDCHGNILRDNLIFNTYGNKDSWRDGVGFQDNSAYAFGIVMFLENDGNQLLHNTIMNTDDGIHIGTPMKNNVIKDNTLYNNRLFQLTMAMGTYTGTASLNYNVQNNVLYALDPGQWTLGQTKRDQKNWLFGVFENNFYGHPYYNSNEGQGIGTTSGGELYRYQLLDPQSAIFDLDWWKTETGYDKNSKTDAEKWVVVKINNELYDVGQVLSPNLVSNSTFEADAAPWEVTAGTITQEKKAGMDGFTLHFKNDYSDSLSRVNNGHAIAFEKDQYYQLSFSSMRPTNAMMRVGIFDRTSKNGVKLLGGRYRFPGGPTRRNYTYLFKLDELGTDMRIFFLLDKTDTEANLWIDNVELYKVALKKAIPPQERSKIFVNRGAVEKTFALNGNVYKDLNGATVKDSVTVEPYSSKILTYVSTTPGQRPGVPNFFMNLAGRKLTAEWSAMNATGYRLYYAPYPACSPLFVDDVGPATSITIDNLLTGTAYYATVAAYNQYGQSDFPVGACLGEASYFIVP
jgi:parallel beta-helix repeat protein